jgi:hypothetical protein
VNVLKKAYRWLVDHLTKVLGTLGTAIMAGDMAGYLEGVKAAAAQYLPSSWSMDATKLVGIALFVLVIVRGWWTGQKAKQLGGSQ